jgi:GNAT superfamily N-acetyltransferase
MPQMPRVVDFDPSHVGSLPCCGVLNPRHEGRCRKVAWLKSQAKVGVGGKLLMTPENRQCGYIEYIPGEHAWRGVEATGYLFIHCIWTFYKRYQHRGLGGRLLEAALEHARTAGMAGVAAIARDRPWSAGPAVYLANGFTEVDFAPPDYRLMVRKLDPEAPSPKFSGEWERKLGRYAKGLTIIESGQCPHAVKFAREIAESAESEFGTRPKVVRLRTAREARNAPTPFAVFAIILNGRLLADHPISRTRFRNIMRKLYSDTRGRV